MRRPAALLLALPLAAATLAGCGGGGGTTTMAIELDGKKLFNSYECWSCHHFTAAGSDGDIGPDLDLTTLTPAQIETQIRDGTGTMPPYEYTLTDEQIASLVSFIVANRRS